jgi:hypothetical protein
MAGAHLLGTALLLVLLGSCGGKPMDFPTPESELGDRPGLFTGDKGSWEVFSRDLSPPQPADRKAEERPR